MAVLSNKVLSSDTRTVDKIPSSNCIVTPKGNGDTSYSVQLMSEMVKDTLNSTASAAQDFKPSLKKGLQTLAYDLGDWFYNNYQYAMDYTFQDILSPSCAKSRRHKGVDCKSATITISSILLNLKVPHYIREIQQPGDSPGEFTHVYVVIVDGNKTHAIDGTISSRIELPRIDKKDVFMNHRGLNAPKQATPVSVSRAARMMANGTTKGVRSIGARKLSKWHHKGLASPPSQQFVEKFIMFKKALLNLGVNAQVVARIENQVINITNTGRFPNITAKGNIIYVDDVIFNASRKGLAGFGVPNTTPSWATSPAPTGGTPTGTTGTTGSGSTFGGLDLSNLANLFANSNTAGSSGTGGLLSLGLTAGATALLGPIGGALSGILTSRYGEALSTMDLTCTNSWYDPWDLEHDVEGFHKVMKPKVQSLQMAVQRNDFNQMASLYTDMIGFCEIVKIGLQAKIGEARSNCSISRLTDLLNLATQTGREIKTQLNTSIAQLFDVTTRGTKTFRVNDWEYPIMHAVHIGRNPTYEQPIYVFTPNSKLQQAINSSQSVGSTNGTVSANNPVEQSQRATAGISTKTVLGGLAVLGVLGTLYVNKDKLIGASVAPTKTSKSRTK